MDTYALVDADGRVANRIAWDGASDFTPPDGHTLRPWADDDVLEPDPTAPAPVDVPVDARADLAARLEAEQPATVDELRALIASWAAGA